MSHFKGSLSNSWANTLKVQVSKDSVLLSYSLDAACIFRRAWVLEFSFTIVVGGFLQDDLGGAVNGVDLLFLDGLDSLDSI